MNILWYDVGEWDGAALWHVGWYFGIAAHVVHLGYGVVW
jgi:hypothetical protein